MKTMTDKVYNVKDALTEIRLLGLTASYSSDWKEFTVNFPKGDGRRTNQSDFKTQDPQDAVDTARFMAAMQ
jgi:hypothetical protein